MTHRALIQQMLEALSHAQQENFRHRLEQQKVYNDFELAKAITAAKEYLAAPEQSEPVGYWQGQFTKDGGAAMYEVPQESAFGREYPNIPLYTAPPCGN